MPPRVQITTLGCRLNQAESDELARGAAQRGLRVVRDGSADVCIVNTCCITAAADRDSRAAVRRIARDNPTAEIIVTGCWATAEGNAIRDVSARARVVHNADKDRLWELDVTSKATGAPTLASPRVRSRAFLKLQDGCDYRCSFCIVPSVRGPSRSVPPEMLRKRLWDLVRAGYREVVLTGVHLGTWGRDLAPRRSLVGLLRELADVALAAGGRIRLGSLDPHEVDAALVDAMANHPDAICQHLHLPVQSGDDTVLRTMRRAHRADDLARTVELLRRRLPDVALGSDVIVGFPTEDAASFHRTEHLLETLGLDYLHVFSYSPRAGTDAVRLGDPTPRAVKKRRAAGLRAYSRTRWTAFEERFIGRVLDAVVFVRRSRRDGARLDALTHNDVRVEIDGTDELLGSRLPIRITHRDADGRLRGRPARRHVPVAERKRKSPR